MDEPSRVDISTGKHTENPCRPLHNPSPFTTFTPVRASFQINPNSIKPEQTARQSPLIAPHQPDYASPIIAARRKSAAAKLAAQQPAQQRAAIASLALPRGRKKLSTAERDGFFFATAECVARKRESRARGGRGDGVVPRGDGEVYMYKCVCSEKGARCFIFLSNRARVDGLDWRDVGNLEMGFLFVFMSEFLFKSFRNENGIVTLVLIPSWIHVT